jgi:hypothetical protein
LAGPTARAATPPRPPPGPGAATSGRAAVAGVGAHGAAEQRRGSLGPATGPSASIVRPPPGRNQHEHRLPDQVLMHVLLALPADSVARAMCVCARWRDVAGTDLLWRALCKRALQRYHPDPEKALADAAPAPLPPVGTGLGAEADASAGNGRGGADSGQGRQQGAEASAGIPHRAGGAAGANREGADGEEEEQEVSLSIVRQRMIDAHRAARNALLAERARLAEVRAATLAEFKRAVARAMSWRLAYQDIPIVRANERVALLR